MWGNLCGPFKRIPEFLAAFCLSKIYSILTDFHSQMLRGLLFLALVLWVDYTRAELQSFTVQEGLLELKYCSKFSTATHECGAKLFNMFVPPTSLEMAFYILSYKACFQQSSESSSS